MPDGYPVAGPELPLGPEPGEPALAVEFVPPSPTFGEAGVTAAGQGTLGTPGGAGGAGAMPEGIGGSPTMGGGGAGGTYGVPEVMPEIPGQGMGAGGGAPGMTPEIAPERAVELRAGVALGDRGVQAVQQLREQGVPENVIRQRLGMGPEPTMGPPAPGAAWGRWPQGAGGGMAAPAARPLPEELQRPLETIYPEDYASRVAAAAVAGDITSQQAKQMMAGFDAWQKSPLGAATAEQRRQRDVAERAGDLEQQQQAAELQAARQQQALLDQQRAEQEATANAQRAWKEDYDREMVDQTARYERAIEEAKRARIDPSRARVPIVDALAVAMGQFAAIMTGTPNAALSIINQRLDRDIAAQQQEIKTLEGNVAARRNRIGLLRQRFGDQQVAAQAEKRLQLEQVAIELNRIATTSKVETNRVGAQKLALAIEDQIGTMKAQEQMQHSALSQQLANARHAQRISSANRLAREAEMRRTGMGPWETGKATEMQKRYVPGFGFVASGAAAKEVRENLTNFDTAIRAYEELLSIAQSPGAVTDPKMRAKAGSVIAQADLAIAVAANLGAISKEDAAFVAQQRGDPREILTMAGIERTKQTLGDLRANRRKALSRHHFVPGQMATTMQETKRGEAKPALSYRLQIPGAAPAQPPPGSTAIPETELAP